MRVKMQLDIDTDYTITDSLYKVKSISSFNSKSLGEAFYDAYKDTVDYDNERLIDAVVEVNNVLKGVYGPVDEDLSIVLVNGSDIVSAVITTIKDDKAFIPYLFTTKKYKNQGNAKHLLLSVINRLRETEYCQLTLWVTCKNIIALNLYTSLGFKIVKTK